MKKRVYGGDGGVEEGVGGLYMKGVKSMRDKVGGEAGGKMWEGVQRESSPKGSNARVCSTHVHSHHRVGTFNQYLFSLLLFNIVYSETRLLGPGLYSPAGPGHADGIAVRPPPP